MEISNLLNEEFKVMVIKILTKLGEKNGWTQEVLQQRDGKYKKYQVEDTELKNTLEEFNNRLDKAEENISLKARQWHSPNQSNKKKKKWKKKR